MTITIPALVDDAAARAGDTPFLVCDGSAVGFAEFAERSRRIAGGLARHGVAAGDVVLVWMVNGRAWLDLLVACARIGAIVFAVNTRFRSLEIADILDRTGPKAIAFRQRFRRIAFDALLDEAAGRAGWSPPLEIACDDAAARGVPLSALADGAPADGSEGVGPESGLVLFTTSGTTSAPKFVLHGHRSIATHARHVARRFGMDAAGAVMLQALPYCGVFGFCQAMAAIAAGRPSVLMDVFDAARAVRLVRDHAVTHFNATDDMLRAMAEAAAPGDLESLRLVGAASFNRGPEGLAGLARDHGLPVVGLYGMSEVQALYARRSLDDPEDRRFLAGGRPVSDAAAARVRDPESGSLLRDGERGELELHGPSLFSEYFGDPGATEKAMTPDGYVRTGDLGARHADGSFTFDARMGDSLRLGGFLVNPDEIAGFIAGIAGIRACQVVGVTVDDRVRPAAFVVLEPGAVFDPAEIRDRCAAALAPFKVPQLIHVLDEFPAISSPNGVKIQRGELRKLARALVDQ